MIRGLFFAFVLFFIFSSKVLAVYDPTTVVNNRVGVHVLSPDELGLAAKLINNDGKNSWGYVTVPIQTTDRDRGKWIKFMKKATDLKIIPIIRVATLVENIHWQKPQDSDLIDFANFLNDLPWPTQNRYVIIFNEVNRADEFGGVVSPEDYADILNNAIDIFKRRSDKFFILPSALDNAASNGNQSMRWDVYLERMHQRQPEIFNKIDGWNSHAYGNPGFSTSPALSGSNKADSFRSDLSLINNFTKKKLPIFITEAGWSNKNLDDRTIATFFNHAFYNAWAGQDIVAVTPFLLFAGDGPFVQFSLLTKESQPTLAYQAIQAFTVNGQPLLEDYSPPTQVQISSPSATMETIKILGTETATERLGMWQKVINFFLDFFKKNPFNQTLFVEQKKYQVEVVETDRDMSVGLAKYDHLEDDQGMLFRFKTKFIPTFWMKEMKFDIDIVWISDDTVVGVSRGFAATPFNLLKPTSPVNYVLEVNQNSGIKLGDQIKIDL